MAKEFVKDVTDASFVSDVIEQSNKTLVLVDFWATWCGPCRTLGPIIERVVNSYNGKVRLAKVNVDENPHFAGQLRVQSIPAVYAFLNGQPVDGFMGALPESQVKAFIEKNLTNAPQGEEEEIEENFEEAAKAAFASGDVGGAAQNYAKLLQQDPQNVVALSGLARCYLKTGDLERAKEFIAAIPANSNDADVVAVKALVALADDAKDAGDVKELLETTRSEPENLMHKYNLARAYIKNGDFESAVEQIFNILKVDLDWNAKSARHLLLKIFEAMGSQSEITKAGRRRLSSILFS